LDPAVNLPKNGGGRFDTLFFDQSTHMGIDLSSDHAPTGKNPLALASFRTILALDRSFVALVAGDPDLAKTKTTGIMGWLAACSVSGFCHAADLYNCRTYVHCLHVLFFLSACFLIRAQQQPKRFWLFTALAMLMATINLFCMEYFLLMHLLQPVMLWPFFQQKNTNFRQRLILTIKAWWPYFVLFIGDLVWRTVFFQYQTHNYQYLFLNRLKHDTIPALIYLLKTMLTDWWNTTVIAWVKVFKYPFSIHGDNIDLIYLGITIAAILLFLISIYWLSRQSEDDPKD
jgi:hypothetical protein